MPTTPKSIPPDVQLVARILDEVFDEYEASNKVIFQNESERARYHFATVHRGIKKWSKSQQCMVPGCGQRSIARSHTVPKSMSLRVIEENGHVRVPSFDQRRGEAKVENVGLSAATTFPGFCTAHELLFQNFESKGSIDTEPEIYLQIYRTACRELFRAQFVVEQHDWVITEYCKARDAGFNRLIRDRAKALGLQKDVSLG